MTLSKLLGFYGLYTVLLNYINLLFFIYSSHFSRLLKLSTLDSFKQNNHGYGNLSASLIKKWDRKLSFLFILLGFLALWLLLFSCSAQCWAAGVVALSWLLHVLVHLLLAGWALARHWGEGRRDWTMEGRDKSALPSFCLPPVAVALW